MDSKIAWFAGLFEGEGTIILKPPRIQIGMHGKNLDLLQRCKDITGVGRISGPYPTKTGTVVFWHVTNMPDVWKVLHQIIPLLGTERTQQAEKLLQFISTTKKYNRHKELFN